MDTCTYMSFLSRRRVFGTTTRDFVFPHCGTLLQARLGARGCPAFSVETACSGFIYALSIADKFIRTNSAQRVLVVGAETLSRITDFSDRTWLWAAAGCGCCSAPTSNLRPPGLVRPS